MSEPGSAEVFIQSKGIELINKELMRNYEDVATIKVIFKIIDTVVTNDQEYKELFAESNIGKTIDEVLKKQGFDKKLQFEARCAYLTSISLQNHEDERRRISEEDQNNNRND